MKLGIKFRICTLVTDWTDYGLMRTSFENAGFHADNSHFDQFDNSNGNRFEPYSLINHLIAETQDRILIICHQDIRINRGADANDLMRLLEELARQDSTWAVAGSAGSTDNYDFAIKVLDPVAIPQWNRELPVQVNALDECILIINPNSRACCSSQLSGFHLYGTDICLQARLRGGMSYVINFPISHGSAGNFDSIYSDCRRQFQAFWNHYFDFLYVQPGNELFLSRWKVLRYLGPKVRVRRLLMRNKLTRGIMTWQLRPRLLARIPQ